MEQPKASVAVDEIREGKLVKVRSYNPSEEAQDEVENKWEKKESEIARLDLEEQSAWVLSLPEAKLKRNTVRSTLGIAWLEVFQTFGAGDFGTS